MPIEWNLDPEMFSLFDLISIRYYSVLFVSGLIIGISIVKKLWINKGYSLEHFDGLSIYVFIAIIVGARLGHCLFYEPDYYLAHPLEMLLPFKLEGGRFHFVGYRGLASHGGILAVFLSSLYFSRRHGLRFFAIADMVCIGGAITAVFIRMGNFMNSEIIGKPTHSDYGVIFRRVDDLVRHPSQLYEAIAYLIIFWIILVLYRRKSLHKDGFVLGVFTCLLFATRFVIEFTKINQVGFEEHLLLNLGQLLSLPFFIAGSLLVWFTYRTN